MRIKYCITHPIQYLAPLLRALAAREEVDLEVIYAADMGAREYYDPGFSRELAWDVSVLQGYKYLTLTPGGKVRAGLRGARSGGVAKYLDKRNTDAVIIHGWGNYFYLAATLAAALKRIPILYRTDINRFYDQAAFRPLTRTHRAARAFKPLILSLLFKRIDGFLAVGSLNREYYLSCGVSPERIFSAPLSINNDLFAPERASGEMRDSLRKKLDLKPHTFKVIFNGKLIARKRPRDMVEAVAGMEQKHKIEVIFLGDGELMEELKALARDRGLAARFAGFVNQSELPAYYSLGDLLILPSENEPWGLVVNEAMAMGLPAAVSDMVGCAPDLVIPGRTGYIFPVGDVKALAEIIARVAGSAALQDQLRAGAAAMAASHTMAATVDGYIKAIQAVVLRAARP